MVNIELMIFFKGGGTDAISLIKADVSRIWCYGGADLQEFTHVRTFFAPAPDQVQGRLRKNQRKQAPIGLLRPIGEARRCLRSSLINFMALVPRTAAGQVAAHRKKHYSTWY